jgi:LEA14-like dessication related protein
MRAPHDPTMPRLGLLLASALLLSGCASLQRVAAGALDKPRLHFEEATVAAVDLEGTTVVLHFALENPNDISFRVAGATWRLEVEAAEVADGELPGGVTLPARTTAPFAVTVRLRWADVARLAEQARRQAQVAYRVDGAIRVETPIGEVALPYQHEGRVPVPRLPALRLARASVEVNSLTDLTLDLTLDVENPNAFPLPGTTLQFDLLLNGVPVATGREAMLKPLGADGEARLTLPIRVSLLGAGRALTTSHGGGELRLRGTVRAGGLETPIDVRMELGRR